MPKRKITFKLFCFSCLFLLASGLAAAQMRPDIGSALRYEAKPFWPVVRKSAFSADSLRLSVEQLCDSTFAGRLSGSREMVQVSAYIASRFRKAGLQAFGGTYFHNFELPSGGVGHNVAGCIPGRRNEWIVLEAWYDSLGCPDGLFYPGADANASALAMLFAIAGRLPAEPECGIILLACDAHHNDAAGAKAFIKQNRKLKINRVICLDIVGSSLEPLDKRRPRYLMALGGKPAARKLERCARLGRIEMYYDYYRSDSFTELFLHKTGEQKHFYNAGLPCTVFTSGITYNTNRPSDTPESLDYLAMRDRALVLLRYVLSLIG